MAIATPEEAVFVAPGVVRIKVDVHARDQRTLELEHAAKPSARRLSAAPFGALAVRAMGRAFDHDRIGPDDIFEVRDIILKAAVGAEFSFQLRPLQFQVASAWFQTRRSAQGTAFEEGLEGSREDFPPSMQRRQLLRSFNQATKELGDGPKRLGGGNRAGVHAGNSDSGLSRMAHPLCDGVQQQGTACDGFSVPIRLGQTNKDVPPIIKQRDHARRQATARDPA